MPENKIQHYVPRCHLRPFTLNSEGVAINLFNIKLEKSIKNAPVKNQCAKDYFYGNDGSLEQAFVPIEGRYATLIRSMIGGDLALRKAEMSFLRDFSYMQSIRTEMARKKLAAFHDKFAEFIGEDSDAAKSLRDVSEHTIIHDSLKMFDDLRYKLADLKSCIILNSSQCDFITSDDPAIFTNRFHFQKLNKQDFGLANTGALLFMPLSPKLIFLSYDGACYTFPSIIGNVVETNFANDVLALNELQYIRAENNIYFQRWEEREKIASELESVKKLRPEKWSRTFYAVKDGGTDNHKRFRVVSREETMKEGHFLIHHQVIHPSPPNWLSKMKWHHKPRYVDTRSGAGYVRPERAKDL
jgi:hypothetical protein